MKISQGKTEVFRIRIDPVTKDALLAAAAASNMSASALALIGIRELLREGETKVILPENMRLSRSEKELKRQQALSAMNTLLRERKNQQNRDRKARKAAKTT
ncbi:MAG TPA: hypothetical protein VF572_00770 [Candidatus Saccharimonadales bacterium]|jgi:hypothetical protein